MPTLKQVAERAGVSIKTASRVINNEASVREQTRQAVMQAVRELNYRPNLAARNMRTQRSQVIGFVTDEIVTTPFAFGIIRGAQNLAWQHNWMLLITSTDGVLTQDEAAVEMLLGRRVEAIIYATMYHHIVNLPPNILEVPTILVNCYSETLALPSVVPDEVQGGQTATEALLRRGRRRIGFINLAHGRPATHGRLQGYQTALAAYGIAYDPALVRFLSGPGMEAEGYELAVSLLELPEPPTGLFCGNDRIAIGAYEAIKSRGLRIPQDISVVGFDNQEGIVENLRPGLSTLALPHSQMGEWAVRTLLQQQLDGASGSLAPIQEKLVCKYIKRESV